MKISAIIWVYHPEFLKDFSPILNYKYVSSTICVSDHLKGLKLSEFVYVNLVDYSIKYFENRGKDMLSFLDFIQNCNTPYFIKLHTKKDSAWRQRLIEGLDGLDKHLNLLDQINVTHPWGQKTSNDFGMIASKSCIVSNHEGNNSEKIKQICEIINLDYNKVKFSRYVSGTMFISRTEVFKKYFNEETIPKIISLLEFGDVQDTINGTYTHSLERIFGYIITGENMRIKSV